MIVDIILSKTFLDNFLLFIHVYPIIYSIVDVNIFQDIIGTIILGIICLVNFIIFLGTIKIWIIIDNYMGTLFPLIIFFRKIFLFPGTFYTHE